MLRAVKLFSLIIKVGKHLLLYVESFTDTFTDWNFISGSYFHCWPANNHNTVCFKTRVQKHLQIFYLALNWLKQPKIKRVKHYKWLAKSIYLIKKKTDLLQNQTWIKSHHKLQSNILTDEAYLNNRNLTGAVVDKRRILKVTDVRLSETLHLPQQDLIMSYRQKQRSRRREVTRLQRVAVQHEVLKPSTARLDQLQHSLWCDIKQREHLIHSNQTNPSINQPLPFDPTAKSCFLEERLMQVAQWGKAIFFIICDK